MNDDSTQFLLDLQPNICPICGKPGARLMRTGEWKGLHTYGWRHPQCVESEIEKSKQSTEVRS